ncbi:hypothetical protein, partial [Glutamicibacter protophormiae]|uniref:hypothetical protein n=1 Tax=Glutamicibacter protophormiae TaxID=37930 RepID=UPI0033293052
VVLNPLILSGADSSGGELGIQRVAAVTALVSEDPAVLGSGVLYIEPLDFARQLTTFRAQGPRKLQALSAFGGLFLGSLYRSYLAPRRSRKPDHEPA